MDDEDEIGTSPINLPDPSLFMDDHDIDMDNFEAYPQEETVKGGPLQQRQFLEEENEKRKLE